MILIVSAKKENHVQSSGCDIKEIKETNSREFPTSIKYLRHIQHGSSF